MIFECCFGFLTRSKSIITIETVKKKHTKWPWVNPPCSLASSSLFEPTFQPQTATDGRCWSKPQTCCTFNNPLVAVCLNPEKRNTRRLVVVVEAGWFLFLRAAKPSSTLSFGLAFSTKETRTARENRRKKTMKRSGDEGAAETLFLVQYPLWRTL